MFTPEHPCSIQLPIVSAQPLDEEEELLLLLLELEEEIGSQDPPPTLHPPVLTQPGELNEQQCCAPLGQV